MYSLLYLGFLSFLLALLLTPLIRNRFRRWNVFDHPDDARKRHANPVPRVGGIAIALSYVCSFLLLIPMNLKAEVFAHNALPFALRFLPAAAIVFATGLLDDLVGLKPWQKFAGQIAGASIACWAGVRVLAFWGHQFGDWWAVPLTIVWLVLCTNAVNLIDGVDGLATGVGLFAAVTMLLAALLQNNFPLAIATVPLVGCLLGFLRYNFNPATIFLGDCGSLLLGFLLGCYGVLWSQKSATILGMTAPLMALAIPLLDTGLAVVRRFLHRKPIFTGDRGHIHHRLLDRGMTPRRVALSLYGVCGISAIFSLVMANSHLEGLVIPIFCAAAWIGIQHLGYVEFGVTGRMFLEGAFRRQLSAQISLHNYQQLLEKATDPEECWTIIEKAAREFGFHSVRMVLAGGTFKFTGEADAETWKIYISLSETDFIELTRVFGNTAHTGIVAQFSESVRKILQPKLSFLVDRDMTYMPPRAWAASMTNSAHSLSHTVYRMDTHQPAALESSNPPGS